MKNLFILCFVLFVTTACGKEEVAVDVLAKFSHIKDSSLMQRVNNSLPEGVNIKNITEIKKGVLISGKAESNKTIKLFMDNISQLKIETPVLKSVKRIKKGKKESEFELEVINYHKL